MRKLLIILVGTVFLTNGFCQPTKIFRPQLGIGFHAGLNRSSVDFMPSSGQEAINLYSYGFLINYMSEPHLGVQLELNMSQRGWQLKNDTVSIYSRTMSYFEIPILTHINIEIKNFRINFDLGPYVAFYQGGSDKYTKIPRSEQNHTIGNANIPSSPRLGEITYYGKDIDNKFDYGFMGGIGFGYNTILGEFQLRFRYTQGMKSIFTKYPEGNFRFSQMHSFYFGAAYCYTFKFKGRR